MIRELKDENTHLRDEMANLRKSFKSKQSDKKQQVHNYINYVFLTRERFRLTNRL